MKTVSVEEVAGLQAAGYTLLDVRPAEEFEESHPPGAVSVPLFGPIKVDSPSKLLKQLMYSANGMKGTDENVNFVEEARAYLRADHALAACSGVAPRSLRRNAALRRPVSALLRRQQPQ